MLQMKMLQRGGFGVHCTRRFNTEILMPSNKGKKVKDRETVRLEPDVIKLFQKVVDLTEEDKGRILNEAIRVNCDGVVEKILSERAAREAAVDEKLKKMDSRKDKQR